ncbi:DUF4489 domain-containing protein [Clostridium ihumii]|uniref:DUF4489 domain-containing protein n=1 Tax=Clostridium ihumii TaxID=1470356 RepID=UPI0005593AA5|nr:DUF4489 domain-containing protein [Clostridium ihumii]
MSLKSNNFYDRCNDRKEWKCADFEEKHDCNCCGKHTEHEGEFKDMKCCNQGHCNPGHPLPTDLLFACGQGTGVAIPIPTIANPNFTPITLASVTVDNTCLCNPSVKIDFHSLINYQALISAPGTLSTPFTVTFQLSKTCCDGAKIALGTWDYAYGTVALATNITNSFSFSYCECNVCPGCCVYTVDIVRVSASLFSTAGLTVTENSSIRSSNISAISVAH